VTSQIILPKRYFRCFLLGAISLDGVFLITDSFAKNNLIGEIVTDKGSAEILFVDTKGSYLQGVKSEQLLPFKNLKLVVYLGPFSCSIKKTETLFQEYQVLDLNQLAKRIPEILTSMSSSSHNQEASHG